MLDIRLYSSTRLVELNSMLVCAAWIAFRLKHTTSVEVSLALAKIEPARYHILWLLFRYLVQQNN